MAPGMLLFQKKMSRRKAWIPIVHMMIGVGVAFTLFQEKVRFFYQRKAKDRKMNVARHVQEKEYLWKQYQQLQAIYNLTNAVQRVQKLEELYNLAIENICTALNVPRASILLVEPDRGMTFKIWRNLSEEYRKAVSGHTPWSLDDPAPQPVLVEDVSKMLLDDPYRFILLKEGIQALAFIPLVYEQKLLGKFMVYYEHPHSFQMGEIQLAQNLASQLSFAISKKIAELALEESEERFRQLAENIDDFFWLLDFRIGKMVYMSKNNQLKHIDLEEMRHNPFIWMENIHPDDRPKVEEALQLQIANIKPFDEEYRYITPAGDVIWTWTRSFLVCDEDGTPYRVAGISKDITARKQAENQVRYRLAIESLVATISSRLVDAEGEVVDTEINNALERLGLFTHSDRCYLLLVDTSRHLVTNTHEWCAEGISPQKELLQTITFNQAAWTMEVMQKGKPLQFIDVDDMPPEAAFEKELLRTQKIQSVILVPLMYGPRFMGMLGFDQVKTRRTWDEDDVRLLKVVGEVLINAIHRRDGENRLLDWSRRLEALRYISLELAGELNLDRLLNSIVDRAVNLVRADGGGLYLAHESANILERKVILGENLLSLGATLRPGEGIVGRAMVSRQAVIVPDYSLWNEKLPHDQNDQTKAVIAIPILWNQRVLGVLSVAFNRPHSFYRDEIDVLTLFAHQAAIAIENASLFERVKRFATTDALTGIYNRRHFLEMAGVQVRQAVQDNQTLSIILMDVDHFKAVNDTYGHPVGDAVLNVVVRRCREHLREIDLFGRYGGEEFMALLPGLNQRQAREVAERLRRSISDQPIQVEAHRIQVTISLGVVEMKADRFDLERLLVLVDDALYQAKAAGRNQVAVLGA